MPVVSKAQNAAMHAAAEGHSTLGIPQKVGAEFTADQRPGSVKSLPQRVKPANRHALSRARHLTKRGVISNAQHDRIKKAAAGDTDAIKQQGSME